MNWKCIIDAAAAFLACQGWLQTEKEKNEFLTCLIRASLGALPIFIDSFSKCISGYEPPPGGDEHRPGSRRRCG